MSMQFVKATKKKSKLRLAIDGPSGSGKTYTALVAATAIAEGGKIAVIDTERGSASLYSDKFNFDTLELENFDPALYIEAISAAEEAGYSVIVIDSLSHAWEGEGGVLDQHDQAVDRQKTKNAYTAWKDVTPAHRKLVDAMLQSKCHLIATMRSKMDYVQEKDDKGTTVIRKVGMAPIQRQGMEYEFTIVGDMDLDHKLVISKSRCEFIADAVVTKPTGAFFKKILDWLNSGADQPTPPPTVVHPAPEPKPTEDISDLAAWWPMEHKRTWEEAKVEKDINGTPYINKPNEDLDHMLEGVEKALTRASLTEKQRNELLIKKNTIEDIKRARDAKLQSQIPA